MRIQPCSKGETKPSKFFGGANYRRVICACCFFAIFVNMGICSTTFNVYLPFINAQPFMSDTYGSMIMLSRCLFSFLSSFAVAIYYRTFDCRVGVALMCFSTAVGFVIFSIGGSFAVYLLGSVFTGIAYGLGAAVAVTLLIGRWFEKNEATALGIASVGSGLALFALPEIYTGIILTYGLSASFLFSALLAGLVGVFEFIFLRNYPPAMQTPESKSGASAPDAAAKAQVDSPTQTHSGIDLPENDFRLVQIAGLLMALASVGSMTYASVLLHECITDSVSVALAISIGGVVMATLKIVVGWLMDRVGSRKGTLIMSGLQAIGILVAIIGVMLCPALALVGTVMYAGGGAISNVGTSTWLLDFSTETKRAVTVKRFTIWFNFGTLLCNVFPGFLFDLIGTYTVSYVMFAVAIICCMMLINYVYKKYDR